MKIMSNFDAKIAEVLGEKVKARLSFKVCLKKCRRLHWESPLLEPLVPGGREDGSDSHQGHLDTYRFCDEVWTFILKDVKFKMDNAQQTEAERVKIVACQSKDKQEK